MFCVAHVDRTSIPVPAQPPTNGMVLPSLRRTTSSFKADHNEAKTSIKTESDPKSNKANESTKTENAEGDTKSTTETGSLPKKLTVNPHLAENGDVKTHSVITPTKPDSVTASAGKESDLAAR